MVLPSQPPRAPRVWDDPRIVMPDEETWSRLSPSERAVTVNRADALFA